MEGLLSTMSDLRFSTIAVAACVGELQQGGVGEDAQPGAWGGGDPGDHSEHMETKVVNLDILIIYNHHL